MNLENRKTAAVELGAIANSIRFKKMPSRSNTQAHNYWYGVLDAGENVTGKEMLAVIKKGIIPSPNTIAEKRSNAIFLLLHERLAIWIHKYGMPTIYAEVTHDLVELALQFEFIYDYYFAVQRAQEKNNPKAIMKFRKSYILDEVIELGQHNASNLAASFLYKKLEDFGVNVLHYPEPKDLVSTMWSETNYIFINKTILKPCANIWRPCLNMIADNSKQKACSPACRSRVKYWRDKKE